MPPRTRTSQYYSKYFYVRLRISNVASETTGDPWRNAPSTENCLLSWSNNITVMNASERPATMQCMTERGQYGGVDSDHIRLSAIHGMGNASSSMNRHWLSALWASNDDNRWKVFVEPLPMNDGIRVHIKLFTINYFVSRQMISNTSIVIFRLQRTLTHRKSPDLNTVIDSSSWLTYSMLPYVYWMQQCAWNMCAVLKSECTALRSEQAGAYLEWY